MKKKQNILILIFLVVIIACSKEEKKLDKLTNNIWKLKTGNLTLHKLNYTLEDTIQSTFATIEEKTYKINFISDSVNRIEATGELLLSYENQEDNCISNYLNNYNWRYSSDKIYAGANNSISEWILNINKIKEDQLELIIDTVKGNRIYYIEYYFEAL